MLPKRDCFRWLATVILLFVSTLAMSQKKVSGKITNATNQPVAGASVIIKGTNTGTTTDDAGNFSITVPNAQSVLVVSVVGYVCLLYTSPSPRDS